MNEIISQAAITKREKSRQKIMEGMIKNDIPEQSQIQLAIPTHRTRKQISFEEFKKLIVEGKTLTELCKLYSKHLMGFYSFLSKGKVNLTREQFIEEYEKGISLDEISRSHNIPREHITALREFYGIKRKGAKYIKRLQNEVPLSQEAKDIIIGSVLGDAHIHPSGYFSEKHSEKQVTYLEWKASFLKPILTSKSFNLDKQYDKRFNKTYYSFCLRTAAHSYLYEIRNKFYKEINGKWVKIIPDDIENLLNEKVLAIWFMDDGNTDWAYRDGIKQSLNSKPQCKISSESFNLEENAKLLSILGNKFNLFGNIRFKNKPLKLKPYIRLNCESSYKLTNLLKSFSTLDLLYKFDENEYLRTKEIEIDKESVAQEFIKRHNILC